MFELVLGQKRHYSHIQSVDACTCARSEEPPLTSLFLDYEAFQKSCDLFELDVDSECSLLDCFS